MLPSSQIRERDAREASFQVLPAEIGHIADTFEVAEPLQHRAVLQVLVTMPTSETRSSSLSRRSVLCALNTSCALAVL